MNKLLIFLSLFMVVTAYSSEFPGICGQKLKQKKFLKIHNKYATGFSIKKYKGFYLLSLERPWSTSKEPQLIFLVENKLNFPTTCQKYFNIEVPVKTVASLSTSHLPALELIGELGSIKAFSNLNFVYNPSIKKTESESGIFELGSPPSSERLLALAPNVVFSYAVTDPKVEGLSSALKLKLPLIFISEFREVHPLGRAEWIKVFGLFYNKLDLAKQKFREIETKYNEISLAALKMRPKKKVIIGELVKGVWKAPGGKSDLVTIISDAGGDYIWSENESSGNLNINFEKVMIEGKSADIWLPHNMSTSLDELMKEDLYRSIKLDKKMKIFNNTNRLTSGGGNDFWETALMRPDLLIQDLITVLHPDLNLGHDLIWYKSLE